LGGEGGVSGDVIDEARIANAYRLITRVVAMSLFMQFHHPYKMIAEPVMKDTKNTNK